MHFCFLIQPMSSLSRLGLVAVASSLLLSCANTEHLPPSYPGPVATIDQTVRTDFEKRNCGFVLAIDDKTYTFSGVSTLKPVVKVEAGRHRLLLRGHVVYLAELRNFAPSPHAEGWVNVNLAAGKRYLVQTSHDGAGTSVWLSDAETGHPVSPVIPPGTN